MRELHVFFNILNGASLLASSPSLFHLNEKEAVFSIPERGDEVGLQEVLDSFQI
jgi:hypothetical protein